MSLASKLTLAGACAFTGTMVWWVHKNQDEERSALREGVARDLERQERKDLNRRDQDEQIRLRKRLEEEEAQRERHSKAAPQPKG
jgi:hypothetical protein